MPRQVDLGIWDKLTKLIYLLFLVTGLIAVALWYMPLIKENEEMRKEIKRLDFEIASENAMIRELQVSIDAIKNDPATVERLARERLGYAKPGETVIRFKESRSNPGAAATNTGRAE